MKPSKFSKKCQLCERPFWAIPSKVKAGKDKFCSLLCYGKSMKGKPSFNPPPTHVGVHNNKWKGDSVGYDALHDWVRRHAGKANHCTSCGKTEGKFHWANVTGEYRRDLTDFWSLCVSCHKKFDWLKIRCKVWRPDLSNISLRSTIGSGSTIHAFVWIGDDVKIGRNCKIQAHAFIPNGVTIGDGVFIGPGANFANHKNINERDKWHLGRTTVEDDVSIGMGALIGAGVRLGKGCLIGMGAVVLKDCEAGKTYVGNPARELVK